MKICLRGCGNCASVTLLLSCLLRLVQCVVQVQNKHADQPSPAHLCCSGLLPHKRQQETFPLIAHIGVNSQDKRKNKHYPYFLSWQGV